MKKVITYGTFDFIHQGHINILRRAKALGDYLIVGVTSDIFDRARGKLNIINNVLERVEAVKATGYADEVIIEDYIGQKIDDIQKYNVDIFAIGSDWEGKFDYLNEFTKVVYLPRTEGISSTMLRNASTTKVRVGIIGCGGMAKLFSEEASVVDGLEILATYSIHQADTKNLASIVEGAKVCTSIENLYELVDAVYIATSQLSHYQYIKDSILAGKHVLCDTPMVLTEDEAKELFALAEDKGVILMEANKTAYSPAFNHLMVMIKSGLIGEVIDVEASISILLSDHKFFGEFDFEQVGGSLYKLGSYPLLPIIRLLGCQYENLKFYSRMKNEVDIYTKGILHYRRAVCSFKVGLDIMTEGNLVISGTKGYAYVPTPWWKTEYFEIYFNDQNQNQKYFYKWDGSGLRYAIQEFILCIKNKRFSISRLRRRESICIAEIMEKYTRRTNFCEL